MKTKTVTLKLTDHMMNVLLAHLKGCVVLTEQAIIEYGSCEKDMVKVFQMNAERNILNKVINDLTQ